MLSIVCSRVHYSVSTPCLSPTSYTCTCMDVLSWVWPCIISLEVSKLIHLYPVDIYYQELISHALHSAKCAPVLPSPSPSPSPSLTPYPLSLSLPLMHVHVHVLYMYTPVYTCMCTCCTCCMCIHAVHVVCVYMLYMLYVYMLYMQ